MSPKEINSQPKKIGFIIALVLLATFLSYWPSLKNNFVNWDDDRHVYKNTFVRSLTFQNVKFIFQSAVEDTYIPLTSLSFAVEHHFFGYKPFVYHLDNLILHLGVVALVVILSVRLGLSLAGAGIAALFFGLHPVHVESVAWVTERKDVLYGFFYMLALFCYLSYLQKQKKRFYLLSIVFGILSMLAKPMALSLPLILFVLDWFEGRKFTPRVFLEKIPYFLYVIPLAHLTYALNARVPIIDLAQAPLVWLWTFTFYLRQFISPLVLIPLYKLPHPISFGNPRYYLVLLAFILLIAGLFFTRKNRWVILSFLFYFFSIFFLLRFDDMADITIVSDRFMYLPSLGFCLLIGFCFEKIRSQKTMIKNIFFLSFAVVVVIFSFKTFAQCQIWQDSTSLWSYQLRHIPQTSIALNNLSTAYYTHSDYKSALHQYYEMMTKNPHHLVNSRDDSEAVRKVDELIALLKRAITISPRYMDAYSNLGSLYLETGRDKEAVEAFRKVIAISRNTEESYYDIIKIYNDFIRQNEVGQTCKKARGEFMGSYKSWIKLNPRSAVTYFDLGNLCRDMNDYDGAVAAYQQSIDVDPKNAKAFNNLASVYSDIGRFKEAIMSYQQAIKIDPNYFDARINLGLTIYRAIGSYREKIESFKKAKAIDPSDADTYCDLGFAYDVLGQTKEAIESYKNAVKINPRHFGAYYHLGNSYARLHMNMDALRAYQKAIEIKPDHVDALAGAFIVLLEEGEFKQARMYYEKAKNLGYKAPREYLQLLNSYAKILE